MNEMRKLIEAVSLLNEVNDLDLGSDQMKELDRSTAYECFDLIDGLLEKYKNVIEVERVTNNPVTNSEGVSLAYFYKVVTNDLTLYEETKKKIEQEFKRLASVFFNQVSVSFTESEIPKLIKPGKYIFFTINI